MKLLGKVNGKVKYFFLMGPKNSKGVCILVDPSLNYVMESSHASKTVYLKIHLTISPCSKINCTLLFSMRFYIYSCKFHKKALTLSDFANLIEIKYQQEKFRNC